MPASTMASLSWEVEKKRCSDSTAGSAAMSPGTGDLSTRHQATVGGRAAIGSRGHEGSKQH